MEGNKTEKEIEVALRRCAETHLSFSYPWNGLEDFLKDAGRNSLALIGYGSLINQKSAGRTINVDGSANRLPVMAYGAIRVFNYRMTPNLLIERYGTPRSSKYIAALNCELTGNAKDQFNGILTQVDLDSLEPLRGREKEYGLKPVVYHSWGDSAGKMEVAYILELLPDQDAEFHRYDSKILPHIQYTKLCQEGALAISQSFLEFFNETCFLGDKVTNLSSCSLPDVDPDSLDSKC